MSGILSLLIWVPVIGALLLLILPRDRKFVLGYTLVVLGMEFLLSLLALGSFDLYKAGEFQLMEKYAWIPSFGINYILGVDGLSLLLVVLTTLIALIAFAASIKLIQDNEKLFAFFFLILTGAIVGVFSSLNLFLFFVFYEMTLIPAYFLIGIFGDENRYRSVFKFFIYTMLSGIFMGVAIIYLYLQTGTFDYMAVRASTALMELPVQIWLFLAFALAFAVKSPLFPFHSWLPDTYVSAPISVTVMLSALMAKMGTYGFIRFAIPLFPQGAAQMADVIAVLAIIGIIYGGFMAAVQTDLKRLLAYSSFAHMGFIILGIFAFNVYGLQGASIQMINHALTTGVLFMLLGFLYVRYRTTSLADIGGLAKVIPFMMVIFAIFMLASIGLPGLNGFIGEFLALLGAYNANPWWAYIGVIGVIVAAYYMLPAYQKLAFLNSSDKLRTKDMTLYEFLTVLIPLILVFAIGVYPRMVLQYTEPTSASVVEIVKLRENIQPEVIEEELQEIQEMEAQEEETIEQGEEQ